MNQSGVSRGVFDEAFVQETHRVLDAQLQASGARVDRYYYCPHYRDGNVEKYRRACSCRKPMPGMVHQAARELGLDLAGAFVVGDRWLDVQLAQAVGAGGIPRHRTGDGASEAATPVEDVAPVAVVDHLLEAAGWIIDGTTGAENGCSRKRGRPPGFGGAAPRVCQFRDLNGKTPSREPLTHHARETP